MTWLTTTHLTDRFGVEAITTLQAGGADAHVALADAQAECESWIGRVVLLPIVTPGAALLRIACDIARYNLWRRQLAEDHPAFVAYRRAVGDLEDASAGRMTLAGLVGSTAAAAPSPWAVQSASRVFTDERLALMDDPLLTPGATL